jgi:hypothetical protein
MEKTLEMNVGDEVYAIVIILGLLALPSTVGIITMNVNASTCDTSYPDVCIASPPPKLNCGDIADKNFQVVSPDPHGFDHD